MENNKLYLVDDNKSITLGEFEKIVRRDKKSVILVAKRIVSLHNEHIYNFKDWAVSHLISRGYAANDILVFPDVIYELPILWYSDEKDNACKYFPDICIKSLRVFIDVMDDTMYKRRAGMIQRRVKNVFKNGFSLNIWVFSEDCVTMF